MGGFFTKALAKLQSPDEMRVIICGLDAAGKTTLLYKLGLGNIVTTIPTIGFNVETCEYGNLTFTVWDVGGRDKIRPLWRHYYVGTVGFIFVVDSNDKDRIDDRYGSDNSAKEELHRALSEDELRDAVLLVFANKQDLPNAMSVSEVTNRLGLNELRNRIWHIQGCTAATGEGLYEGLDWLSTEIEKHPQLMERSKLVMKQQRINYGQFGVSAAWDAKTRKLAQEKIDGERKKRRDIIESNQKSILVVSGYIREFYEIEADGQMMTFIPASVTRYVHLMFHDPYYHCHRVYKFYGEYTVDNNNGFDTSQLNIEQQVILNQFLNRMEDDNYVHVNEEFMKKYIENKGKLNGDADTEKWDHYDFVRFIWISFTKHQLARMKGTEDEKNKSKTIRQLGMKDIWANTPYSTTKTYFWAQLIFYGLKVDASFTKLSCTNFNYFLVQNPCLSNNYKNLINNYYSSKLIQEMESDEKRNEMILPDIMALPSLITNVEKIKQKQKEQQNAEESKPYESFKRKIIDDSEFISDFENLTFKSWDNHESFIRIIWCYLNNRGMTDKNIMTKWSVFKGKDYHETQTYFWITMTKYYRMKYKEYIDNKDKTTESNEEKNNDTENIDELKDIMNTWSFEGFLYFCEWKKYPIGNNQLYLEYYSEDIIQSDKAIKQMIKPDKKEFPK